MAVNGISNFGHKINQSAGSTCRVARTKTKLMLLIITVFKTINNYPPEYLRDLFRLRDNIKNLRGVNKLQVPKPNTTRYGKNSVKYLAAITDLEQDF